MPPIKKFQKEKIINTAYEIVRKEGFSLLNARRVAKELGGSVQPIYHNFATMEELNDAVKEKIYDKYEEYMNDSVDEDRPYLAKGMGYIKFAKEYPEFFRILFMGKSNLSLEESVRYDKVTSDSVIKTGQSVFNLSYEEQLKLHVKIWLIAHGIACLVVTGSINYSEGDIKELLANTTREIIAGHKLIEGGKNE